LFREIKMANMKMNNICTTIKDLLKLRMVGQCTSRLVLTEVKALESSRQSKTNNPKAIVPWNPPL
jgi:hypothetical protein